MKTHVLKCWRGPFSALVRGDKTFEFRKNDRDYEVGDHLHVREWDHEGEFYTGNTLDFTIPYLLKDGFGVPEGFAILSLRKVWED